MILAIQKPRGWTSFDVVEKVRSVTGEKKVGHAGTLDPFAEGLLVVGVGRESTQRLSHIAQQEKEYRARIRLGISTDTLDTEGNVVTRKPVPPLTRSRIEKVFKSFTGTIQQVPPMYSAKKVGGTRLYELARENKEIPRRPATVTIKELTLEDFTQKTIRFSVVCSKGTYIRQLGADVAQALGTVGYLEALTRIRIGNITLKECHSLQDLEQQWLSIAE
ncbi:MAG: tRNA pseudouridine(55) synthase TruB [Fidelibacterota bacterium]